MIFKLSIAVFIYCKIGKIIAGQVETRAEGKDNAFEVHRISHLPLDTVTADLLANKTPNKISMKYSFSR